MDFARMAKSYRDELDMYGFTKAQIVNSEYETLARRGRHARG